MKKCLFKATLVLALFALSCGTSQQTRSQGPVLRAAIDTPEYFEATGGVVATDNSCKSPLLDPNDGTRILMVTSFNGGMADYEVPDGKYGVNQGELLRINCKTGEVVGVVRR